MDWSKYGVYDFPATVKEIQKRNGGRKVAMVGHSQGTTQTYAGMGIIPQWYDENVSVGALLGPCTTPGQEYFIPLYTYENWKWFIENDIWVMDGPNWETDRAKIFGTNKTGPINPAPQIVQDSIPAIEHL